MEAVLPSRAGSPGVEEVGGEGRCHIWSVVPQAHGYPTVSTLQRITSIMLAHSFYLAKLSPHYNNYALFIYFLCTKYYNMYNYS